MPIPFLLAGLGVAAGVIGAGGHLSAKETNERAERVSQDAQELYNNAKQTLEAAQNKTEKALVKLGYDKKRVLDTSMKQFLPTFEKVKHIQLSESVGIHEIAKFTIDQQDVIEVREMTDVYSSCFASSATGVAAGAAVALAASGALPIITGELSLAGSALAAGEISAAVGFAGSALSFGAAMTPLAAVAAPVMLFTGISASMKADENLEKANTMYAEAEVAVEKMKISETLCEAITEMSEMFDDLLENLNTMFAECTGLLTAVVRKREGRIFKKKLTKENFSEDELELITVTSALAKAVKSVIDTPILSKDGNISYDAENVYDQMVEGLDDWSKDTQKVKAINYNVKPIVVKEKNISYTSKHTGNTTGGISVMSGARKVFAFIIGIFFASAFAEGIASIVTGDVNKFLFLDSFTANKIAIWLLLCTSAIMLIGKFKSTIVEKMCGWGSGLSVFILYAQYCRSVEQVNHYIIFSVIVCIVCAMLTEFFDDKKQKWNCGHYFSCIFMVMMLWPIGFLIYAFFSKFIGFSESSCLIVTSVIFFIISVLGIGDLLDDE